ncbi:hypothetical protein HD554DRAFT_2030065 [Boletus coccyginus]|nr:hypothetical protein HD554DRAFT_2030065 [Boletus coccyginus]
MKFWTKNIWIIPIHQPSPGHWLLCLAYITHCELCLFDSFAEWKPWLADVNVWHTLYIFRILPLTTSTEHYEAYHLTLEHCEKNPF